MRGARLVLACVAVAFGALPAAVRAQDSTTASYPQRCGAGVPATEGRGYVPLPRGDVFCPLLADPKAVRSFVSYQRGDETDFAANIAAVGIADQFGFFRIAGARHGDGIQLGIAGGVFAQFDLDAPSFDLINADYVVGLPLTIRRGGFSSRLRIYHQSSHLGDEFLLRPNPPTRENLSFESGELLLSQDVGPLRVYAGGEHFFRREPVALPERLVHGGVELRPQAAARIGRLALARVVAAADVKVVEDSTWRTGIDVRAGIEVGRPREGDVPGRRWSLLAEFYDGPSPYGQFQGSGIRLTGVGFHFSL